LAPKGKARSISWLEDGTPGIRIELAVIGMNSKVTARVKAKATEQARRNHSLLLMLLGVDVLFLIVVEPPPN
jgi:hypothetical protein